MAHRDGRGAVPAQLSDAGRELVHRLAATDATVHHRWSRALPPVLEIEPGDRVEIETRTGDDGQLAPGHGPEVLETLDFGRLHALTGPIAVRGAGPGDWLAVEIEDVRPAGWGFLLQRPGAGLLRGFDPYLRFVDLDPAAGVARFAPGIDVPIRPFLGVMGVAPAGEDARTIEPGRHGGNLDCRELVAGTTLYLPVQVDEALFSCGDGHAAQGDGEVCVTAIECALTSRLRFRVCRPRAPLAAPFARTPEGWLTLAAAPTVEAAAAEAISEMIELLAVGAGLSRPDAYALCSAAVDVRINQLVNGEMVGVRAVLPASILALPVDAVLVARPARA